MPTSTYFNTPYVTMISWALSIGFAVEEIRIWEDIEPCVSLQTSMGVLHLPLPLLSNVFMTKFDLNQKSIIGIIDLKIMDVFTERHGA